MSPCVLAQRGDQRARLHEEDARVPAVAAVQDQHFGHRCRRFLDEARHRLAVPAGQRLAGLDVAVGRARETGHHAEGDDPARQRRIDAGMHGAGEEGGVGDVMVRRREQQQVVRLGHQRGRCHRCSGVARNRLQDLPARDTGVLHRFLHQEAVVFRGHAGDVGVQQSQPLQRELQQALAADQRRELLGQGLARQRPQPRAAAAAQDHGMDGGSGFHDRSPALGLRAG